MPVRHLQSHLPNYNVSRKLFSAGMMVFFFVLCDGILMYLVPIVITGAGISESVMGLIVGSSSIAGLLFDFFLCRALRVTHYRRVFLFMFILAAAFPLFLFGGTTVTIYLLAMAAWGFYYDFYNIGTLDFVERTARPERHVTSFGILRSFEGSGYLVAPFAGSLLLLWLHPGPRLLLALAIPFTIAFLFYLSLVFHPLAERPEHIAVVRKSPMTFFTEMGLWEKIGTVLLPILFLTLTINLVDAAIWTFGPLFSEYVGAAHGISGGIFMTAYALPPLLVGSIVGAIARKFGNAHTAQFAIAIGSLLLLPVGLVKSPVFLIVLIFTASFFISIGWPSINAVYTQYIERVTTRRKEIETLQDLFTNFGDTLGPIVGGYLSQYLGFSNAFVALGIGGGITAMVLFAMTPRTIVAKV